MAAAPAVLDLTRFAIKIFAAKAPAEALEKAVPVFHRWIQNHALPGILVDVADYGHLPQSPGVVLVSHEANVALDATEGPLGLLYTRKAPLEGPLAGRLQAALGIVLEAAAALEGEPEFGGSLAFRADELLFLSNDRLTAPNSDEAFSAVRPALEAVFGPLYGEKLRIQREGSDPRRRLAIRVASGAPVDLSMLRALL